MANLVCPYCGHAAIFEKHLANSSPYGRLGATYEVRVGLSTCPGCGGIVAIGYTPTNSEEPLAIIPNRVVGEPDALIPAPVRADLYEARKCMDATAWKAAAAMCRRALQGACLQVGASPGKSLNEQIAQAIAANKVHGSLEEWARAIRLIGNSGAHPGDGLETVTREEAEDLVEFTEEFLRLTFVVTERVRARLAARQTPAVQ